MLAALNPFVLFDAPMCGHSSNLYPSVLSLVAATGYGNGIVQTQICALEVAHPSPLFPKQKTVGKYDGC